MGEEEGWRGRKGEWEKEERIKDRRKKESVGGNREVRQRGISCPGKCCSISSRTLSNWK